MAEKNNAAMTVYFLIPVFNEEKNIELLSGNIQNCLPGVKKKYVFADDGSTDSSASLIHRMFNSSQYVVLGDGKNHGPGHAFNIGFEWILNNCNEETDVIVTMEADNTSDLKILPVMLMLSDSGYNLVLASVYSQGGGFDKTSFLRKSISSIANIVLRSLFNIKVQTLSSFYRIYRVPLIKSIKENYGIIVSEPGFLCMIEMLLKAIHTNANVIEVPMVLKSARRKGKSKMKVFHTSILYLLFLYKNLWHAGNPNFSLKS